MAVCCCCTSIAQHLIYMYFESFQNNILLKYTICVCMYLSIYIPPYCQYRQRQTGPFRNIMSIFNKQKLLLVLFIQIRNKKNQFSLSIHPLLIYIYFTTSPTTTTNQLQFHMNSSTDI